MDMTFRNRKFALAVTAMTASIVMVFMDKIGAGEWIACITIVLGLYGMANVMDKKAGGAG